MVENQNQPEAAELPLGEAPPEAVQIELPIDELQPGQAKVTETPPADPKKARGGRQNERIQTLTHEKHGLLDQLERERQEKAALMRQLDERTAEVAAGQQRQMDLHKARLQSETERARNDYGAAVTAQDVKGQTEATARLARAESGLADVEAWEAHNKPAAPPEEPRGQPVPPQRQAQPQLPRVDAATATWMDGNPWFMPLVNGRHNPDYDHTMHLTAVAYAARLEAKLKAEGKADQIAKDNYWGEINQYMAKEFPERFEIEGEEPPVQHQQPARTASPVVPAVRSQPAQRQATNGGGKVIVELSGPERGMADNLRNSGALKYPMDHPNTAVRGQRMSKEDSYREFYRRIQTDKADQDQQQRRA